MLPQLADRLDTQLQRKQTSRRGVSPPSESRS
jgi:hypothetical protein